MLKKLKLTPSMVVAFAALAVAIGGTATAATVISGSQIKNGTVTKSKLTPALRRQIDARPLRGLQGPPGGFDPAKVTYVLGPSTTMAPGDVVTVQAFCPPGTKAIGGGYLAVAGLVSTIAIPDGSGWQAIVGNDTGVVTETNAAFAVCAAR